MRIVASSFPRDRLNRLNMSMRKYTHDDLYTHIYIYIFIYTYLAKSTVGKSGNKFIHVVSVGIISRQHSCHDFLEITWLRLCHNWSKCTHCARITCLSPTGVSFTLLCLVIYVRRIAKHRRLVAYRSSRTFMYFLFSTYILQCFIAKYN